MANTFDIQKLFATSLPIRKEERPFVQSVTDEVKDINYYTLFGTPMSMPLWLKKKSETEAQWWQFPLEPIIRLGGGNVLAKRSVAKAPISNGIRRRGTIKERWTEDDFSITIEGVFINPELNLSFPESDIKKLYELASARESLSAKCALFEVFGISSIVVESFDFPFTKSKENQTYSIKALSDDDWELLIKLEGKTNAL